MEYLITFIVPTLAARLAAASSCTFDTALPLTFTKNASSTDFDGDETCDPAASFEDYCNSLDPSKYTDSACSEQLKHLKRDVDLDLDCEGSEECFSFQNVELVCLDQTTGDFHNGDGGNGNVFAGVYTDSDGSVETAAAVYSIIVTPSTTLTAGKDSETSTTEPSSTVIVARDRETETVSTTEKANTSATAPTTESSAASATFTRTVSITLSQSSATSPSASTAAQTGGVRGLVTGPVGPLLVAALPALLAAL